jgi:protein-S-isoprenylcysteine O-methyltransferase Ste14
MTSGISATERSTSARIGQTLFRNRGWLPVPFLAVPLLAPGNQSARTWIAGITLVLLGEAIRIAGVSAAGTVTRRRSREVQRLVTYGAFAWCRNPLYVGNFFIWLGFWFLPIAILIFAMEYTLIVRYEEGVLESIFGEEYLEYKKRTPRWVPRPPRERQTGQHDWQEAIWSERSTIMQYLALSAAFWWKGRYL